MEIKDIEEVLTQGNNVEGMKWVKYDFTLEKGILVYNFLMENEDYYERFHCSKTKNMYHFHILIDEENAWILDEIEIFKKQKEFLIAKKIYDIRNPYPDRELYPWENIMLGNLARELLSMYDIPWVAEIQDISCLFFDIHHYWVSVFL